MGRMAGRWQVASVRGRDYGRGVAVGGRGGCRPGMLRRLLGRAGHSTGAGYGAQVGIASVPLVVVLTVLGAWAERAPEKKLSLSSSK